MGIIEVLGAILAIAFEILKVLVVVIGAILIAIEMLIVAIGGFIFNTLPSLWQQHPVGVALVVILVILGGLAGLLIAVLDY